MSYTEGPLNKSISDRYSYVAKYPCSLTCLGTGR